MTRVVWKGRVLPGKLAEYIRRHAEIWPEMTKLFDEAGIHNYSIWNYGDELFGYYECESYEHAAAVKAASRVMAEWSRAMDSMMQILPDPSTGAKYKTEPVFLHR